MRAPPARAGRPVAVLDRIIAILDAVKDSGGSTTITELAACTAMPKSTVSRLVAELTAQRYLERTEDGVTLGLRLFELGARASLQRKAGRGWTTLAARRAGAGPATFTVRFAHPGRAVLRARVRAPGGRTTLSGTLVVTVVGR